MIKTGKSYHQYKVFAFSYLRRRGVYAVNFTQGFNGWSLFLKQMASFSWTLPTYGLELPCTVTCGVQGHKDNLHHLASARLQGKLQNSLLWPPITQVSLTNSWEGTLPWKCQETENPPLFSPVTPVSPALSPAPLPSSDRRHSHPTEILFQP